MNYIQFYILYRIYNSIILYTHTINPSKFYTGIYIEQIFLFELFIKMFNSLTDSVHPNRLLRCISVSWFPFPVSISKTKYTYSLTRFPDLDTSLELIFIYDADSICLVQCFYKWFVNLFLFIQKLLPFVLV